MTDSPPTGSVPISSERPSVAVIGPGGGRPRGGDCAPRCRPPTGRGGRTPFESIDYRPEGRHAGRPRQATAGVDFELLTEPAAVSGPVEPRPASVRPGAVRPSTCPKTQPGSGSRLRFRLLDQSVFAKALWTKLAINSSLGVIGVLSGAPNGAIADPDTRWLFESSVEEVAAVARAEGVDLPPDVADRLGQPNASTKDRWTGIAASRRRVIQPANAGFVAEAGRASIHRT